MKTSFKILLRVLVAGQRLVICISIYINVQAICNAKFSLFDAGAPDVGWDHNMRSKSDMGNTEEIKTNYMYSQY